MKTNQKTLVKEEKKVYYIGFRKSTRGREHKAPGFVSKEARQRRTKQKADQDVQAADWGFYYYENTWTPCSPYGSSAFPRTLPVGRWEILLFACKAGGEWSCILSLRSTGMVWCRAGKHYGTLKGVGLIKASLTKERSPFYTWEKLRLIKQIRIRFGVLS